MTVSEYSLRNSSHSGKGIVKSLPMNTFLPSYRIVLSYSPTLADGTITMKDSTIGSFLSKLPQIFTVNTIMTKHLESAALPIKFVELTN